MSTPTELAKSLQLVVDPARLNLIALLQIHGPLSIAELAKLANLTTKGVGRHIHYLMRNGVVQRTVENITYEMTEMASVSLDSFRVGEIVITLPILTTPAAQQQYYAWRYDQAWIHKTMSAVCDNTKRKRRRNSSRNSTTRQKKNDVQ